MFLAIAIIVVSALPALGAFHARRSGSDASLVALYTVFTCMSQVLAAKIAIIDLGFAAITFPTAVPIFAVTFLITDVVNERFGRSATHRMILAAFVAQVALLVFVWIATNLTPAPFWGLQEEWDAVFSTVPRITIASWATFLISENLDAILFDVLRRKTRGRHLWLRNAGSSVISLTVDTVVFVMLAFAGTGVPLAAIMAGQFVGKYAVALLDIPFMYINRSILGGAAREAS